MININTDERISKITVNSLIDFVQEYRCEIASQNMLIQGMFCDDEYIGNVVLSCLTMPSDFYDGIAEAFDWWEGAVLGYFPKHDWDKVISFDEISEGLYLKSVFSKREPRSIDDLHTMADDLRAQLKYYELSQWFKWNAIECAEVKSKIQFFGVDNEDSNREWAENIIKEYGEEKLHIANFFEFGFEYGIIIAFDSAWRTLNSST